VIWPTPSTLSTAASRRRRALSQVLQKVLTFLKADVLRSLRRQPMALKLYAWGRTHRPDDRGRIFYNVSKLAQRLGCSDQNSTRRRRKVLEAVEAVCAAAPDEFTGYEIRQGRHDQVLTLKKKLRRPEGLPAAS
jgi:hypothetical protein